MITHTVLHSTQNKSKLLCFNVEDTGVILQTYLNGEVIPVVDCYKHL